MQINREVLLRELESVDAGLSTKEIVEQSSCFVFNGDRIITFNGEVACHTTNPLKDVFGAVPAKHLKELLLRIPDNDIDVSESNRKLSIKAKGGRGSIALEKEIAIPIDQVEMPDKWKQLHGEFCEGINIVQSCAAKDSDNYKLTCVHITPEYVEACDNYQLSRYSMGNTGLDHQSMVKRDSIKFIPSLGMVETCETETWVHFRNASGLVLSCRRWVDSYQDLGSIIQQNNGSSAVLPGGLADTIKRAQIFAGDDTDNESVQVRIKGDKMLIRGEGATGFWEEKKKIKYNGEPIAFDISPNLLMEISNRAHECTIGPSALRIDSGNLVYITSLEAE